MVAVGNDLLYLRVREHSKTWITRRRINGRWRIRTLGHYPDMPVREARAAALDQARESDPNYTTVETLAENWLRDVVELEHKRPHLTRGYVERAVIPDLGSRRVSELTPADIAASVQRYRERGTRAADAVRSVYRSLMTHAVETGIRADNPAAALTRRIAGYRPIARERVLSDDEIRLVWQCEHHNAPVLRFLLLTGLRIAEAQKGHRKGERWIVPAEISKNSKAHWVHLTKSASDQLPLPRCTATNIQQWTKRLCIKHEIDPAFTPHDCRRTAATRMANAGIEPFIVERALNHTLQGVMGVYNRATYEDERIAAAKALEREILAVADKASR
jgi:integrase